MFLWHIVPSWHQIEDRIRQEMGYQGGAQFRNHWGEPAPSLSLNIRRVESVRTAFYQSEWQAGDLLRRRFADLDISVILNDLIDVVTQMAMIVAGSTLTGGAIGAGVGAFFGGAGAIPMGAAGAALGMQASGWILTILGLQSVAEFFVEGLPRIGGYYLTGIQTAWEGPRGEEGLTPFSQDDPFAVSSAAHNIALGHVEVVVLLLGAIVEYLTRGRGNAGRLAQEMGASPKGANIGQWMLKHEDALKSRPDLQKAEPHRGAHGSEEPQASTPSPNRQNVKETTDSPSIIDQKARTHILDGDGPTSGGHRFGTGIPGKSEFPKGWSDEKIVKVISDIAKDPDTQWSKPDMRGYATAFSSHEGVDIKVVYDTVKDRVVTGYPTNTPKNPKP